MRFEPEDPTIEWALPAAGETIRQGDVVVRSEPDERSLSDLFFVMTADCDLANTKHHGRLLCVPIVPIARYVAALRLARDLEEVRRETEDRFHAIASELNVERGGSALTAERAAAWVGEETADGILSALDGFGSPHERELRSLWDLLRRSRPDEWSLDQQIGWLTAADQVVETKTRPAGPDWAARRIRELVTKPPRDAILISEASPDHKDGYVVALRFPEQIFDSDVSLAPGHPDAQFRRVSRICSPYRFSISQQFGLLYTSVGLPDSQRDSVRISAELVIERFAPTKGL